MGVRIAGIECGQHVEPLPDRPQAPLGADQVVEHPAYAVPAKEPSYALRCVVPGVHADRERVDGSAFSSTEAAKTLSDLVGEDWACLLALRFEEGDDDHPPVKVSGLYACAARLAQRESGQPKTRGRLASSVRVLLKLYASRVATADHEGCPERDRPEEYCRKRDDAQRPSLRVERFDLDGEVLLADPALQLQRGRDLAVRHREVARQDREALDLLEARVVRVDSVDDLLD